MRPNRGLFWGLWIWLALAIIAALQPSWLRYWQGGGMILLALALFDALRLWRCSVPMVRRELIAALPLGVWSEVKLELRNPNRFPQTLEIFDGYPVHSDIQALPQTVTLPPRNTLVMRYRLRPQQRGATQFTGVYLLIHSPWQFWKHYRFIRLDTPIRVYPNFAAVAKYTLFALEDRLGQLGIRKLQRRGEGLEFHQLREYRAGDTLRQIDWNASSRLKKLISKEYQDERDQQLIFLIDCGRRMLAKDGDLSHFDHTLNAVLLLSYVALRQGDALGLLTFSGAQRWLKPRKGVGTINQVLNAVYDLQPSLQASDYLAAANQLMHHQRKRSLVILISNLRDEEGEELLPALKLLKRKHLVLLSSLQEQVINEVLHQPVHDFASALRHAATCEYLTHRHRAHERIRAEGVLYLDSEPTQLPVHLVNRYLEIKRSGML